MKPMGWRFVVVTDAGERTPAPVPAEKALQSPEFQKNDSAVRGLQLLMEHAGGAVQVEVLSSGPKDVAARFREAVFLPETQALKEPPIGLIVADVDFSHLAGDLAAMADLAEMAKILQAPVVAQASPGFFGLKQLNLLPKINDLPQRLSDGAHAGWQKFQKQEGARWVALMLNRYLQRAPAEGEKPEDHLWGRSVWILAAAAARSVREGGHALDLSGVKAGRFSGLPVRPYPKAANQTVPLSVEVAVPEQLALEISRAGFITLVGTLGTDSVMIPIAVNTYRSAPGKLTVSGTLGYQLMAGRLAQVCGVLLDEMPSGPDAAGFLQKSLVEFLGPLAGSAPDAAVTVVPGDGLAEVTVQPAARIEGMELKFVFQLPIRR